MPVTPKPDRDGNPTDPGKKQQAALSPVEPAETTLLRRKLRNQASGSEVSGWIAQESGARGENVRKH